tara:strand:- start:1749 stop:2528 length:780 start_codon:yes stop_codon:yes gene_type:complete
MNQEEKILRENIRQIIRLVKQKNNTQEEQLRQVVREFIDIEMRTLTEGGPDVDPTPNKSTGINVLEELLKKIIPIIETDYKSLTTNTSQRESYRSHIINAVVNSLTPAKINNDADGEDDDLEEEVSINVGDDAVDDKFIDIRTDAEKSADDEKAEEDPRDAFGADVEGDETGRNVAYQSFKKIETSIIDSYELLGDPEDQELFYDYLIANLKLYFDKFEEELSGSLDEPTNQAYDDAAAQDGAMGSEPTGAEDELELEL